METEATSNTGAVIKGAYVHVTAGSIIGTANHFHNGNDLFEEVNLSSYSGEHYIIPTFAGAQAEQLRSNHLLLLAGSYGFDKESFARHLAYVLTQSLPGMQAKEWIASGDMVPDFLRILPNAKEPGIFILPHAGPKDIGFDLEKIRKCAEQYRHFVLITSDLAVSAWQLPEYVSKKCCFEIPSQSLYSIGTLEKIFIAELEAQKLYDAFETTFDRFEAGTSLTSKHTVSHLSTLFQTPEQLCFFTEQLGMEEGKISAKRLDEIIAAFQDQKEPMIGKWFKGLDAHEKMIVLGAALFDGLHEDLFFEVIKQVSEEFWHIKNPHMSALDYCDLDFMMNFFKFETYQSSVSIFKGKFPNQRADILKATWYSHRQHIMAVLPVLARINVGLRSGHENSAVFNSRERQHILRSTMAELLSDIGLLALPAVESSLMELASIPQESMQQVTAKALARWRMYGREEQLFSLLWKWQRGNEDNDVDTASDTNGHIKRAILFTLKYAAEYDAPNHLNQQIIELLLFYVHKRDDRLHQLLQDTVQKLTSIHYLQLKDTLPQKLMVDVDLSAPIVNGICIAYEQNPGEVKQLLEDWISSFYGDEADAFTDHDQLLINIFQTYQRIPYAAGFPITVEEIWSRVQRIYRMKQSPPVRTVLLDTIAKLTAVNTDFAITQLEELFPYIKLRERGAVLQGFSAIYIDQRQKLQGGDFWMEMNNQVFPGFRDKERPLTAIEQIMYRLIDSDSKFAQQFSLLALVQFAKDFDLRKARIAAEPAVQSAPSEFTSLKKGRPPELRSQVLLEKVRVSFWKRLCIGWWLLFESSDDKHMIKYLIKVMLQHAKWYDAYDAQITGDRMSHHGGRIAKVGLWLKRISNVFTFRD